MKPIGSLVAQVAFSGKLCKEAAQALHELKPRVTGELKRLGFEGISAERLLMLAETNLLAAVHLCESPIEQVMFTALSHMLIEDCFPPAIHDVNSGERWPEKPVVVAPQFVIARYRLDFLVVVKHDEKQNWFAVECDGADFHSNKQHRQRDASRDDYLRALGIRTIRYSGSWIIRNSWKVADEIAAIVRDKRKVA